SNRCVPTCTSDATCSATSGEPYCAPGRNVCVECLADANCRDVPYCSTTGRCVECVTDANCAGNGSQPYCEPSRQRCVECMTSANCHQGQTCARDFTCN